MRRAIHFLRKKNNGYISIESVIIAGLVVGLGAGTIGVLHNTGEIQVATANTTITEKLSSPTIWKN